MLHHDGGFLSLVNMSPVWNVLGRYLRDQCCYGCNCCHGWHHLHQSAMVLDWSGNHQQQRLTSHWIYPNLKLIEYLSSLDIDHLDHGGKNICYGPKVSLDPSQTLCMQWEYFYLDDDDLDWLISLEAELSSLNWHGEMPSNSHFPVSLDVVSQSFILREHDLILVKTHPHRKNE